MKRILLFIIVLGSLCSCKKENNERYLFFLHNAFLETRNETDLHPQYGKVEYSSILKRFSNAGLNVISEQRKGNVNAQEYAQKVVKQIDSLINVGVKPNNITIVGTSKGGYIAQYVSTFANNPNLNFVFVACYSDEDITRFPTINFCGNILNIYDVGDAYSASAVLRKNKSTCSIKNFKEIELDLGLGHGFICKNLDAWIAPIIQWSKGDY